MIDDNEFYFEAGEFFLVKDAISSVEKTANFLGSG